MVLRHTKWTSYSWSTEINICSYNRFPQLWWLESFRTDSGLQCLANWMWFANNRPSQPITASSQLIVDRITLYFCSNTCHLSAFIGSVPPQTYSWLSFLWEGGGYSPHPPLWKNEHKTRQKLKTVIRSPNPSRQQSLNTCLTNLFVNKNFKCAKPS